MSIIYEHALTEHTRLLIKLEALYLEIEESLKSRQKNFASKILFLLIELTELTGGQDLLFDLLRHLNKKDKNLQSLVCNPDVNNELLEFTLKRIDLCKKTLGSLEPPPWQNLLRDHFVQSVKSKYNIRGTLNPFELPQLNFWTHQSEMFHINRIDYWLEDFKPIAKTIKLILEITRDSATHSSHSADNGFYQHLNSGCPAVDLIRVIVHSDLKVFPEVTGNKHKFLIRFLKEDSSLEKPSQTTDSIKFELALVAL